MEKNNVEDAAYVGDIQETVTVPGMPESNSYMPRMDLAMWMIRMLRSGRLVNCLM